MLRLSCFIAAFAAFLFPVAVLADEELSKAWQLGFSIYEVLAPVLTALLGWAVVRLNAYIKAKVEHEALAGILTRFADSVFAAVKQTNQTVKAEILKAKDPDSPGGASITVDEAARLRDAVWHQLKIEYGGMKGLRTALGILGMEEGPLHDWIDGRIEAAVHDVKTMERATGNPT